MKNNAKKYMAGVSLVALFGIYSAYQNLPDSGRTTYGSAPIAYVAPVTKQSTGVLAIAQTVQPALPIKSTNTPHTKKALRSTGTKVEPTPTTRQLAGAYRDGTYTGISADAYYGNVQVQVTVSGGVVADVTTLQSPDTHSRSLSINSYALPQLRSESLTAQSARINAVSGATYTSAAYKESIASALSQATA